MTTARQRPLRLAHCSDIHLDGDHAPREYYRGAFARLLETIRAQPPDVLLIAGDLFDANDASLDTIEWSMALLAQQPFPIAMIPGNHDCLEGNGIYQRHDFDAIANVEMLTAEHGEQRTLSELGLTVWGKGMIDHTPEHRPLANCPAADTEAHWYIGLAHGIYVPAGSSTGRSSQISHEEIEASPCDYLAFGHHHAGLHIETEGAIGTFCGSPTDTIGGGATYAEVELAPGDRPRVRICRLED